MTPSEFRSKAHLLEEIIAKYRADLMELRRECQHTRAQRTYAGTIHDYRVEGHCTDCGHSWKAHRT